MSFKIKSITDVLDEHEIRDYELWEDDELCGRWTIIVNHQNSPLSLGIFFEERHRGFYRPLGCKKSEFLIKEVVTRYEQSVVNVQKGRLNALSRGLFETMENRGYVRIRS